MIPVMMRMWKPSTVAAPDVDEDFDGVEPSITLFSSGGSGTFDFTDQFSGATKELRISPISNAYPSTCRLNDVSINADFEAQWDQSQCSDNTEAYNEVHSGFVARTTNWENPTGVGSYNWGMCVFLKRDGDIVLGYSSDSSTAAGITTIASAASGLGAYPQGGGTNTPIRNIVTIKWRADGQSHKVWVDGVLKIDTTSSVYETNSGNVAFFTSPQTWTGLGSGVAGTNQGYVAIFDNLQITNL